MREPSEGVPMPDGLYCLNDVSTMLHFDSTISLHAKAFLTRLPAASAILGSVIGCHPATCLRSSRASLSSAFCFTGEPLQRC